MGAFFDVNEAVTFSKGASNQWTVVQDRPSPEIHNDLTGAIIVVAVCNRGPLLRMHNNYVDIGNVRADSPSLL